VAGLIVNFGRPRRRATFYCMPWTMLWSSKILAFKLSRLSGRIFSFGAFFAIAIPGTTLTNWNIVYLFQKDYEALGHTLPHDFIERCAERFSELESDVPIEASYLSG
jgi:hypothetical protein